MGQYLVPPDNKAAKIAPSLVSYKRGVGTTEQAIKSGPFPYAVEAEPGNPTIIPEAILRKFQFAFLIRHPRSSIPSYYRCCIPPLSERTGFPYFMPSEAGYAELVKLFDFLRSSGQIGPHIAQHVDAEGVTNGTNGTNGVSNGEAHGDDICVIDADDMLDDPEGMIKTYCKSVGIDYQPSMLNWDNEKDQKRATDMFEKWPGFHDDALDSTCLKKRQHVSHPQLLCICNVKPLLTSVQRKKPKTDAQLFEEWKETYGEEGAKVIQKTVEENVPHYEYLKQFAVKPYEPALPN